MKILIKSSCFIIFLLLFLSCKKQILDRKFYIEEFKWAIEVPKGLNFTKSTDIEKIKGKGMELLKQEYGGEVQDNTSNLFFIEKGKFNKFEANSQYFDPEIDGDYSESNKAIKELLVNAMTNNLDDIVIDTISSKIRISNLEFKKFHLKITYPNNIVLHNYMFNRLFKDKELTCNIIFIDKVLGEKMLNSFMNSTFH